MDGKSEKDEKEDEKLVKIPACPSCTKQKQKRIQRAQSTKKHRTCTSAMHMATPWQYLGQAGTFENGVSPDGK